MKNLSLWGSCSRPLVVVTTAWMLTLFHQKTLTRSATPSSMFRMQEPSCILSYVCIPLPLGMEKKMDSVVFLLSSMQIKIRSASLEVFVTFADWYEQADRCWCGRHCAWMQSEFIADCYMRRAYISAFTGSAGTAVVTKDKAALWTDGRYFLQVCFALPCTIHSSHFDQSLVYFESQNRWSRTEGLIVTTIAHQRGFCSTLSMSIWACWCWRLVTPSLVNYTEVSRFFGITSNVQLMHKIYCHAATDMIWRSH